MLAILRQRNFALLWLGGLVSFVGDWVLFIALLLLPVRSTADLWLVYLAAFLQASIALFFQPAESALVPILIGEEHLMHANALTALNWELTRLIAPPLGGLVMALFGL